MYNYRNNSNQNSYANQATNMRQNISNNSNTNNDSKCDCGFDDDPSVFPTNYMYGQSYVPIQQMDSTFKPEVGLKMGTIFPELVSPYDPCQSMRENAYLRNATKCEGQCPRTTNSN